MTVGDLLSILDQYPKDAVILKVQIHLALALLNEYDSSVEDDEDDDE